MISDASTLWRSGVFAGEQMAVAAPPPRAEGISGFLRRTGSVLRPGESALHLLGIFLLVAAVFAIVLLLVSSAYSSRTAYFQKRNLRELDRIAATVSSATETLRSVPTLHFVPSQVDFAISPRTRCLVATTSIGGGAGKPIEVAYHFVPPDLASAVPTAAQPCSIAAPAKLPEPSSRMDVTAARLSLTATLRLSELVWPNTDARGATDLS